MTTARPLPTSSSSSSSSLLPSSSPTHWRSKKTSDRRSNGGHGTDRIVAPPILPRDRCHRCLPPHLSPPLPSPPLTNFLIVVSIFPPPMSPLHHGGGDGGGGGRDEYRRPHPAVDVIPAVVWGSERMMARPLPTSSSSLSSSLLPSSSPTQWRSKKSDRRSDGGHGRDGIVAPPSSSSPLPSPH
jgi:hypothetical protein